MRQEMQKWLVSLCPNISAMNINHTKTLGDTVMLYGIKAMQFKEKGDIFQISFLQSDIDDPEQYDLPYKVMKSIQTVRFDFASLSELQRLSPLIRTAFARCIEDAALDSFGCCNAFIQCSDERKCIHLDNPEYWGCIYRRHLEAGRIFYGKNKTI